MNIAWAAGPAIDGIVVDTSGAPIPGAHLLLKSNQASIVREGETDGGGRFVFADLAPGSYALEVSATDFQGREMSVALAAAGRSSLRLEMMIAPVSSEITVTASRGSVEDISASDQLVAVRNRAEFEEAPAVNLGRALQKSPGVMVQETTYGQVSPHLRGLTGYQTLLLVDGIRYNTSIFRSGPNQYLAFIQPGQADRMETVLGPAGATFGSDSMGGMINVLSLEPHFGLGRTPEVHGEFQTMLSSADLSGEGSGLVAVGNSRLSLLLGATGQRLNDLRGGQGLDSRNSFSRYLGLLGSQVQDLLGERLQGTGFREYGAHSKLAWRPGADQTLTLWYQRGVLDGVRSYRDQLGGPGRLTARVEPQVLNLGYVRYEKLRVGRLDSLSGTFSVNSQRDGFVRQDLRFTDPVTTDRSRVDSYGYSAQGSTHLGGRQMVVFGAEIYDEHVFATRFLGDPVRGTLTQQRAQYPNDSRYRTSALFVQDTTELIPGRLRAVAGARFTSIGFRAFADRNLDAAGQSLGVVDGWRDFRDLTFHTSLAWSMNRALEFHALVGRGFRAPNLNDLGSIGLTTLGYDIPVECVLPLDPLVGIDSSETSLSSGREVRKLGPESLMNYEFGARIDTGKFYARVHWFDAELLHPISGRTLLFPADAVPDSIAGIPVKPIAPSAAQRAQGVVAVATSLSPRAVKTSVNDGQSKYYGLESLFRYRLSHNLLVQGNYTFLAGRDLYPNRPARRLPPQEGYASFRYFPSGRRLWLELGIRAAGAQTRLNGADIDDDRIGASRRRSDIASFFRGGFASPYVSAGTDGRLGTADDLFTPTGETLRQIQDRVLPIGATINGVRVLDDGTRVPLYARTNGWMAVDLRGGAPLSERLSMQFGVLNLADRNFRVHGSGVDSPGIGAFLGFRYVY